MPIIRSFVVALLMCLTFIGCSDATPPTPEEALVSLDGSYETTIDPAVFESFQPDIYPPDMFAGTYSLVVEGTEYRLSGTGFGEITGRIITSDDSLSFADIPAPVGAFNCVDDEGERADTREEGTAEYGYEVDDESLTLTIEDEPCSFRGVLMENTWDRVD